MEIEAKQANKSTTMTFPDVKYHKENFCVRRRIFRKSSTIEGLVGVLLGETCKNSSDHRDGWQEILSSFESDHDAADVCSIGRNFEMKTNDRVATD